MTPQAAELIAFVWFLRLAAQSALLAGVLMKSKLCLDTGISWG